MSGLTAAVALCLFLGRLGSHYIRIGTGSLAFLFLYAAIQPTFPVLRLIGTYDDAAKNYIAPIQTIIKMAAAALKLLLFLRVRELIKQDRILFFIERVGVDFPTLPMEQACFHDERATRRTQHTAKEAEGALELARTKKAAVNAERKRIAESAGGFAPPLEPSSVAPSADEVSPGQSSPAAAPQPPR